MTTTTLNQQAEQHMEAQGWTLIDFGIYAKKEWHPLNTHYGIQVSDGLLGGSIELTLVWCYHLDRVNSCSKPIVVSTIDKFKAAFAALCVAIDSIEVAEELSKL